MKILRIYILFAYLTIIFGAVSCVRYEPQTINYLTIYNLDEASSIEIEINGSNLNYAKINTQLEDGTKIKGDILLTEIPTPRQQIHYIETYQAQLVSSTKRIQQIDSAFVENNGSAKSFPELFGFSKNSTVAPKGSATLLIGEGKSVQIIFYQVDYRNQFGSGIGYDNNNNLYRVYLTTQVF